MCTWLILMLTGVTEKYEDVISEITHTVCFALLAKIISGTLVI